MKGKIIAALEKHGDDEAKEAAEYLKSHSMTVFPYPYKDKYSPKDIELFRDEEKGMFYVKRGSVDMYLKKEYTSPFRAKRYYSNILMEQDEASPHRYTTDSFRPEEGSVILDIGGAEGFFPIDHIDRVKKVYIFEYSDNWIEALNATYAGYGDKVTVVKKFVSDHTDDKCVSLDDFIRENGLENDKLFIKVDAEGSEPDIIKGMEKALSSSQEIQLALCTYHCAEHEKLFTERFSDRRTETSSGYMLYYYDFDLKEPYIRRGVLRVGGRK